MSLWPFGKQREPEFDSAYDLGVHTGRMMRDQRGTSGEQTYWGRFEGAGRFDITWEAGHEFSELDKNEIATTVLGAALGDEADETDREGFIAGFDEGSSPWWKFW
jgi:hypothetical protein